MGERMERLDYDPGGYSGHSFRAGAATTAAKAGVEDSVIKALGRWESSAYLIYMRLPERPQRHDQKNGGGTGRIGKEGG